MTMTRGLTRLLLLAVLMIAGAVTLSAQTTKITTSDDTEYVGTLVSESADTVVIRTESGVAIAVPRSSIREIDYGADRTSWEEGFWGVGGVFGSPGALNVVIERNFGGRLGLRFVGGYGVFMRGVEADGLFRFSRNGSADHNLMVGFGYIHMDGYDFNDSDIQTPFFHFGYNLHWGGFSLQIGVGAGFVKADDETTTYIPSMQIGYVHRFL